MSSFGITWDYRCPFARIAADHVITGLEGGADWDVTWVPFSLTQAHVGDGDLDAWDDPTKADDLHAIEIGIVVRERFPDQFLKVHRALFDARHVLGQDLRSADVLAAVLRDNGVDHHAVETEIEAGWPRATFRKAHTDAVETHKVFGVPTFIVDDSATFVRLMEGPDGDVATARRTIERVLDTVTGWPELNEFKHTTIAR